MHECPVKKACAGGSTADARAATLKLAVSAGPSLASATMNADKAKSLVDVDAFAALQCTEGYKGRLCGLCKAGYGKKDDDTCAKCHAKWKNDLYYS